MATAPKLWKKLVEDVIREAKLVPLWGSPPSFNWDSFTKTLKETLSTPDLEIKISRTDWIAPGAWTEGFGRNPIVMAFEATPLQSHCFWVVSSEELRESSLVMLASSGHLSDHVKEAPLPFLIGFYRFLALQALDSLSQTKNFPGIRFTLAEEVAIPNSPLLSIEILLTCKGVKTFAKILVPKQMLASFRQFFRVEGRAPLNTELASSINVALSIAIGTSKLKSTTWKSLHIGDFLVLDRCSYNPKKRRGKARLILEGKTIASCSIEKGRLQLLDEHSDEEEVVKLDDDEPEEDFSSYDEPEEENEEFVEEEYGEEFNEDLPPEEVENEPEELEDEQGPVETEKESPSLSKEIPITLSVEVARVRMGLDKVLALQPGNIIDLSVSVEQGVTLTSGGKAIARGELIQLGEVIGVKITELG